MDQKRCASCNILKPIVEFHKRGNSFHSYCKECRKLKLDINKEKIRKRSWYLKNRSITIERAAKRALEKPNSVREYKDKYYNENAETVKAKSSIAYYTNKDNPDFKNKRNVRINNWRNKNKHVVAWRSILKTTLKKLNKEKTDSTIAMLGYSANELKDHLESLWLPQMSWENYGMEWHIDHISPIYSFDKSTDIKIVNALSNLRPLWATNRTIDGVFYEGNLNRRRKKDVSQN